MQGQDGRSPGQESIFDPGNSNFGNVGYMNWNPFTAGGYGQTVGGYFGSMGSSAGVGLPPGMFNLASINISAVPDGAYSVNFGFGGNATSSTYTSEEVKGFVESYGVDATIAMFGGNVGPIIGNFDPSRKLWATTSGIFAEERGGQFYVPNTNVSYVEYVKMNAKSRQQQVNSGRIEFTVTIGLQVGIQIIEFGELGLNLVNVELFSNDGDSKTTVNYLTLGYGALFSGEEFGHEFETWNNGSEVPPHSPPRSYFSKTNHGVETKREIYSNGEVRKSESLPIFRWATVIGFELKWKPN
jgi:hypothetical protein